MRRYSGYKEGMNSRGLPSGMFSTPEPKHNAGGMADDKNFQSICKKATERINELIDQGQLPASFWCKAGNHARKYTGKNSKAKGFEEVRPTARQYRRFRNKHGLAYKYGR